MSENQKRPYETEKTHTSNRYYYNSAGERIRDDSEHDGRRKKMRQARTMREVALIVGFLLLTLVVVLIVRKVNGDKEKPSESESISSLEPDVTDTSETDSETDTGTETDTETETETNPPTVPPTEPPKPTSSTGFPPKMNLVQGLWANPQGDVRIPSWITQDLLPVDNVHGREGSPIQKVKHIVIHYVGNTLSQAKDNRDYFAYQEDGRNVSSHFVVGLYGEVIQCVPVTEVSHAQGVKADSGRANHNYDSISIETCHYNDAGQFTNETYQTLVKLTAFLLQQYELPATASSASNTDDSGTILMHFHCSGKACPKYWADNPHYYDQFVSDVQQYMKQHPDIGAEMP